jgi:putative membrane protein
MATRSEPAVPEAGEERRLHPLSWLFVLLQQLKSFAIPLLVLLITGRGSRSELYGLYGVGVLVLVSVARYFTYRFRLDPDGIAIRSGLLQTTRRDIPYERIHNVSLHQSLLHRLFGVAELRLESASGAKSEAEMRVLSLADAQALESIIRERGRLRSGQEETAAEAAAQAATVLLSLGTADVVRLGLISNRGLVLIAAALGTLSQTMPDETFWGAIGRWATERFTPDAAQSLPAWLLGPAGLAAGVLAIVIGAVLFVRTLSVLLAVLQFHGFRLEEIGRQLRVERGLLTRIRAHMPRRRIQAWRLRETLLHRWFGRQSLRVDSAGGEAGDERGVRDLAPLAEPAAMQQLIGHLLQSRAWPPVVWRPLHPHAWRRLVVVPSSIVIGAAALLTWRYGPVGLLALAAVPLIVVRARLWARHAGYSESDGLVATRTGWLNREWEFAEIRKLQSLRVTASPIDRRHQMATLWLDTAGASSRDGILRIPFMPAAEAHALYERLAAEMGG